MVVKNNLAGFLAFAGIMALMSPCSASVASVVIQVGIGIVAGLARQANSQEEAPVRRQSLFEQKLEEEARIHQENERRRDEAFKKAIEAEARKQRADERRRDEAFKEAIKQEAARQKANECKVQ
jgi:hypothetical protein